MQGLEPRNDAERERILSLFSAFGLATGLIHAPNPISISSAARRQGGISILTELGGGGMITPAILREAMHGLLHLLGHVGLLHGPLVPPAPPGPVRLMRIDSSLHYVYAHEHGLFEPLVELGDRVVAGQPAARIHFPESPLREPEVVNFPGAGEVVCKRAPARTRRGDCLFQLAGPPLQESDYVRGPFAGLTSRMVPLHRAGKLLTAQSCLRMPSFRWAAAGALRVTMTRRASGTTAAWTRVLVIQYLNQSAST